MGLVFLAEQVAPVRRLVAMKVIKPGIDSKQVLARFESERQALALLQPPGIAAIHDAGTTPDGHPFFVMEYAGKMMDDRLTGRRTSCRGRIAAHIATAAIAAAASAASA